MDYKTGTLIEFRNRPWVVQQSGEDELMIIKPLGGTDAETIGLYLPLYGDELQIHSYNFRRPTADDIGKNSYKASAKVLYNACRLSFRDIAGPFQCLGKLSFEPRPYQMVPLILALKQEKIRLLISDDVGIGKTLESLLIAKELLGKYSRDLCTIELNNTDNSGILYPEDTIMNTFYHEKVHSILSLMGHELNNNEEFIDLFARLLRQTDITSEY